MAKLQAVITARELKQSEAAEVLRVTQQRAQSPHAGHIDLFNAETLIEMLLKLGVRTKVALETRRRRAGVA